MSRLDKAAAVGDLFEGRRVATPSAKLPSSSIPYARTSKTSQAAAVSLQQAITGLRAVVLAAIKKAGDKGMTTDEVETRLDMRHQTASARVHELAKQGFIETFDGVVRRTRSGRNAQVYFTRKID